MTPSAPPIGEQIVKRANLSIEEFGPIALGLLEKDASTEEIKANMEARKEATPAAAAQRRKLREAIELKNYEFNAHGVEMNHRYRSGAIRADGSPEPPFEHDRELYYHPTTWPGALARGRSDGGARRRDGRGPRGRRPRQLDG